MNLFIDFFYKKKVRRTFGFTDYFATFANDKSHRMMRAYGFAYYFYYFFFYSKGKSGIACN